MLLLEKNDITTAVVLEAVNQIVQSLMTKVQDSQMLRKCS